MRYFILISGMILAMVATASGETYVVNPEGTGDFPTIQAAIDAVVDGDIIELTDGTFTGDGNRDIDYLGKAITVRSQSGDPESCIIDCGASPGSPHRGFLLENAEGPESVIEGVTIQNGYRSAGGAVPGRARETTGGAVWCGANARPTIRNCIIRDNEGYLGGGVGWGENAHPILIGCHFENNFAWEDGGALGQDYLIPGAVTALNCTFIGNEAGNHGGGVTFAGGESHFENCVFIDNVAYFAGALFGCWYSTGDAIGCTFEGNTAVMAGAVGY